MKILFVGLKKSEIMTFKSFLKIEIFWHFQTKGQKSGCPAVGCTSLSNNNRAEKEQIMTFKSFLKI